MAVERNVKKKRAGPCCKHDDGNGAYDYVNRRNGLSR
jgi:hypothetical protein